MLEMMVENSDDYVLIRGEKYYTRDNKLDLTTITNFSLSEIEGLENLKNLEVLYLKGNDIKGIIPILRTIINEQDEFRLLVDYSSMSRLWYSGLLYWVKNNSINKRITIDFLYAIGKYPIDYPPTVEIDVPRTYVGSTGVAMSSDLVKQKILLIRRGKELLHPEEKMKLGDRVIIYFYSNYFMKLTNRVVTELPLVPKKPKKKKIPRKKG